MNICNSQHLPHYSRLATAFSRSFLRSTKLCGAMDVMVGVLRGMGYSVMPMLVSLVGVCGLRTATIVAPKEFMED